jgi:GntR family transcriptional regulator
MFIRIDGSTGVPIWQQIVWQVTRQAVSGGLATGDRLSTVRELAGELRVNPNTVAKAYQELERAGVVETRRGLGTFVCDMSARPSHANGSAAVVERIDALMVEAIQMRLDPVELRAMIEERMRSMGLVESEAAPKRSVKGGAGQEGRNR